MAEQIRDRLTVLDASNREVLQFDARFAALDIGQQGNEGDLRLRGDDGEFTFHLDGGRQLLVIRDGSGRDVLLFDGPNANLRLGSAGNEGDLQVLDARGEVSIHLDGGTGDIVLRNADVAEEFDVDSAGVPRAGSVVVLDDDGSVRASSAEYDRRVLGVVSGAGAYRPGIVLDRCATASRPRVPVAVMGKVSCLVDATRHPVAIGDLLTTSSTPGHAMSAVDHARSGGAVVGKALSAVPAGVGLVPMLVCLR